MQKADEWFIQCHPYTRLVTSKSLQSHRTNGGRRAAELLVIVSIIIYQSKYTFSIYNLTNPNQYTGFAYAHIACVQIHPLHFARVLGGLWPSCRTWWGTPEIRARGDYLWTSISHWPQLKPGDCPHLDSISAWKKVWLWSAEVFWSVLSVHFPLQTTVQALVDPSCCWKGDS